MRCRATRIRRDHRSVASALQHRPDIAFSRAIEADRCRREVTEANAPEHEGGPCGATQCKRWADDRRGESLRSPVLLKRRTNTLESPSAGRPVHGCGSSLESPELADYAQCRAGTRTPARRFQRRLNTNSDSDRPMLHVDLTHGEIAGIRGRKWRANARGGGGNQAVGLVECDAHQCERSPPTARPPTFGRTQWRKAKAIEQSSCVQLFAGPQPAPDFLDRDCTGPWLRACSSKTRKASCGRSAAKCVDEYGRIQ